MITIHVINGDTFSAEAYWVDKTEKYLWFKTSFNPRDKYNLDHQRHSPTCKIPYVEEVQVLPTDGNLYIKVEVDKDKLEGKEVEN